MSKIRQILRLYGQGYSNMAIYGLTRVSRNTLKKYIKDYNSLNLTIENIEELTDFELSELFSRFKPIMEKLRPKAEVLYKLFPEIDKQLKRKGITKQIMWQQYIANHPDGFKETQFRFHYYLWKQQVNPVMHMEHKAGDKVYIDYAGEKLHIVNKETGALFS